MKVFILASLLFLLTNTLFAQDYYPPRGDNWQTEKPSKFNLDEVALNEAINFAQNNEYSGSRDLRIAILKGFSKEPFHNILGPTKKRGAPAGLILKNGYIVAEWGDTERVDMTFSVTKSYLSTLAGLALQDSLIANLNDPVEDYVWDGTFNGEHNQKITWDHLLTQSSDWSGEIFGIKDWADRPPNEGGLDDWKDRELKEPGTFFEYNDVRVNVLSYSLAQVWRNSLPAVLKERIMDPIGASTTWRWFGYDESWINIDGKKIQSVSGGGHSGGGLFINTRDHARFGLLFLRDGKWNNQQLLSEDWIEAIKKPSKANESYGYMWWLNKGERKLKDVDDSDIYYAAGFGGNFIVIDEENDMVVVTRWLEPSKLNDFLKLVRNSID